MNELGALSLIKFRHILTPIAVDWAMYYPKDGGTMGYKSLYIFGVRIARWRADK